MGGSYDWPTVPETREYRLKCRELINKIIDRTPLELPVTPENDWVFSLNLNLVNTHYQELIFSKFIRK